MSLWNYLRWKKVDSNSRNDDFEEIKISKESDKELIEESDEELIEKSDEELIEKSDEEFIEIKSPTKMKIQQIGMIKINLKKY